MCHVTQVFTRHQISESRATLPPPSVLARWVWWEGVNINNSVGMPTDGVTAQGSGQEHNRWVQVTDHVTMGSGFVFVSHVCVREVGTHLPAIAAPPSCRRQVPSQQSGRGSRLRPAGIELPTVSASGVRCCDHWCPPHSKRVVVKDRLLHRAFTFIGIERSTVRDPRGGALGLGENEKREYV